MTGRTAGRGALEPSRPLRVLLHSAAPKADGGGVQNVVLGLTAHLRGAGHEVALAWPDGAGTRDDWRLELTADVGPGERPGARTLIRAAGQGTALARRLASWRPDVVDLHFPRGSSAYFAMLARPLRYRLVLSFHNSDLHEASPALRSALPRLLARSDGVTAVSDGLAEAVRAVRPGTAVTVIPNGVDVPFWSGATDGERDPWLAVAAGRLTPMKGFDLLLRAFAAGAPPRARLILAGEGEERAALEALARELGLGDRMSFAGRLDRGGLRALYGGAGLFVMPSRREGMPLALIEALASGLPALATSIGGVRDVMDAACGETVPPEDAPALGAALGRWLGDGERLRAAGRAAGSHAARFSEPVCYARYEALFAGLRRG